MSLDGFKARQLARRSSQCRHFDGVQRKTCEAGVTYADVRSIGAALDVADVRSIGAALEVLPCWGPPVPCARYEPRTLEEVLAEEADLEAAVAEAMARDASGLCLHCGVKVERRVQVGRCIYAEPCGHRLGQGKA